MEIEMWYVSHLKPTRNSWLRYSWVPDHKQGRRVMRGEKK
jgi:hypothetical protein